MTEGKKLVTVVVEHLLLIAPTKNKTGYSLSSWITFAHLICDVYKLQFLIQIIFFWFWCKNKRDNKLSASWIDGKQVQNMKRLFGSKNSELSAEYIFCPLLFCLKLSNIKQLDCSESAI